MKDRILPTYSIRGAVATDQSVSIIAPRGIYAGITVASAIRIDVGALGARVPDDAEHHLVCHRTTRVMSLTDESRQFCFLTRVAAAPISGHAGPVDAYTRLVI